MTRKNPLLAVPPRGVHGLEVAGGQFFRQHVGRAPKPEDYHGVHTTSSVDIAAVYAIGAAQKSGDSEAYPVIVSLDVSGLKAVPDVDAMAMAAYMLGDDFFRREYEGEDLREAIDREERAPIEYGVGDDVGSAILEEVIYGSGPPSAFDNLPDGEEQWQEWVQNGAYTPEAAIELVQQKRYLNDFGYDRLVAIYTFKPWWPKILEDWDAGEEAEEQIERVEADGYTAVTIEGLINIDFIRLQEIVRGPAPSRKVEYHGTSSVSAQAAFPEVTLPPNPFPLRGQQLGFGFKKLKRRLLR